MIDGEEARPGNAEFCGLSEREALGAGDGEASFIAFAHAGKDRDHSRN
jgi:hypothetical protein